MGQFVNGKWVDVPPVPPGVMNRQLWGMPEEKRAEELLNAKAGTNVSPQDAFEVFRRLTRPSAGDNLISKNGLGGVLTEGYGVDQRFQYPLQLPDNQGLIKAEDVLAWTTDPTGKTAYQVKPEGQQIWDAFLNEYENEQAAIGADAGGYKDVIHGPHVSSATGEIIAEPDTVEYEMGEDHLGFVNVMKNTGMADPFVMRTLAYNFERGNVFSEMIEGLKDIGSTVQLKPNPA